MSSVWGEICRDDNCEIMGVHGHHEVLTQEREAPRKSGAQHDPKALLGSIAKATSKAYPMNFSAIVREVVDDYGTCSERTIYRYLRKLIDRGQILKLDLGLSVDAYIRPKSRLLRDLPGLRDYMLGLLEIAPTRSKKKSTVPYKSGAHGVRALRQLNLHGVRDAAHRIREEIMEPSLEDFGDLVGAV